MIKLQFQYVNLFVYGIRVLTWTLSLSTTALGRFQDSHKGCAPVGWLLPKIQDASLHHYQWFILPKRHFEIRDLTIRILQGLH